MTDEEKAAAAKAEAEKKEAQSKETSTEESETDDEGEDSDESEESNETLEQLKARLKKVNESDKKRRLKNKELEAELAKHKKLSEQEQAVQKAQQEANAKNARILLKGELAMVATDVHDPAALFRAFGDRFTDIDVDLENETVDRDSLKEKLAEIRKEAPYFFKGSKHEPLDSEEDDGGTTKVVVKKNPDKGRQGGGGSEYKEWVKLKESGDKKAAAAFYAKNRDKILLQLGK